MTVKINDTLYILYLSDTVRSFVGSYVRSPLPERSLPSRIPGAFSRSFSRSTSCVPPPRRRGPGMYRETHGPAANNTRETFLTSGRSLNTCTPRCSRTITNHYAWKHTRKKSTTNTREGKRRASNDESDLRRVSRILFPTVNVLTRTENVLCTIGDMSVKQCETASRELKCFLESCGHRS